MLILLQFSNLEDLVLKDLCALRRKCYFKGQLISKCLCGVFNSSKTELENSNFCPNLLGQKFSVRFLEELKHPKFSFEINWPLIKCKILRFEIVSSVTYLMRFFISVSVPHGIHHLPIFFVKKIEHPVNFRFKEVFGNSKILP